MQNNLNLFFEINNLDTYQNHEVIELKASAEFTDEEIMQFIKTLFFDYLSSWKNLQTLIQQLNSNTQRILCLTTQI